MVLTKNAVQRIAKDVKYIMNNPITNIYYKHDIENITKGYALILGNDETPYCFGNYLFEFTFPDNYPYEPPKLKFLTSDGSMRFHPNLYINGKVCLSIINTWNGEGWTSCNNINSILLILISIFDKNSLTFEPGIPLDHYNVKKYDILVGFKNIEYAIIKQIKLLKNLDENKLSSVNETCLFLFKDEIISNFKNNIEIINNNLQILKKQFDTKNSNLITISSYSLSFYLDFEKLNKDLNNLSNI